MPSELTCLRVFIASPSGLAEERKAFRDEIQEFNEADAIPRGVLFQPVAWEGTLGGIGRPQTIINEDVRRADYLVLLLWNRWGWPPDTSSSSSRFTSGTEEEYHVALECYRAEPQTMRQSVIMFKSVDPQQLSDPGPQLQRFSTSEKASSSRKIISSTVSTPRQASESSSADIWRSGCATRKTVGYCRNRPPRWSSQES